MASRAIHISEYIGLHLLIGEREKRVLYKNYLTWVFNTQRLSPTQGFLNQNFRGGAWEFVLPHSTGDADNGKTGKRDDVHMFLSKWVVVVTIIKDARERN